MLNQQHPLARRESAMPVVIRRAVVVEDSVHFRALIRIALKAFGVTDVFEAADGIAALRALESYDADVVVMDWKTRGMSYLDCAHRIRRAVVNGGNPKHPIVVVTGYGCDDDPDIARAAGVDVYLGEPISIRRLYAGLVGARIDAIGTPWPPSGVSPRPQ